MSESEFLESVKSQFSEEELAEMLEKCFGKEN